MEGVGWGLVVEVVVVVIVWGWGLMGEEGDGF